MKLKVAQMMGMDGVFLHNHGKSFDHVGLIYCGVQHCARGPHINMFASEKMLEAGRCYLSYAPSIPITDVFIAHSFDDAVVHAANLDKDYECIGASMGNNFHWSGLKKNINERIERRRSEIREIILGY